MSSPDDQRPDSSDADHFEIADLLKLEPYYHQFETEWNRSPYPDLRKFLAQIPEEHRYHGLGELIQMDLERRWSSRTTLTREDQLPARPQLEDYWSVLTEYTTGHAVPLDLILSEFQVRTRWGDRPDLAEFLQRFPDQQEAIRERCEAMSQAASIRNSGAERDSGIKPQVLDGDPEPWKNDAGTDSVSGHQLADESFRSLRSGMAIEDYLLQAELGRGSSGVVFCAERRDQPGSQYAMKLIRPDRISDPAMLRRFQQEIQVLTKLPAHPNVVRLIDSGEWQGVAWTVMEFIEGIRLDKLPAACSQLSIPDACEILRQTTVGLELIHNYHVTHRDLKPDNLILASDGSVRILDLGMAKLMDTDGDHDRLTPTGTAMGTPGYMAPEQWRDAKRVDTRADIYSLGCTMYYLLAGEPPYISTGKNRVVKLMEAHTQADIPDLSAKRPDCQSVLQNIVKRCMAKEPKGRPQSAQELGSLLQPLCSGADLTGLLNRCSSLPEFGAEAFTDVSKIDSDQSSTTLVPGRRFRKLSPSGEALTDDRKPPLNASPGQAEKQNEPDNDRAGLPASREASQPASDVPSLEETLIRRQKELEATHSESTFKPAPGMAPSSSESDKPRFPKQGTGSAGPSTGVSSVSLRRRDISFGVSQTGQAAEYEIGPMLGAGGMGAVYKARQSSIDRIVALKTVKSDRSSPDAHESFLAEAIITGALEHPNIVPIHDLGKNAEDDPFYAMKEVRGAPWRKAIDKLSLDQNIDVLLKVADAIAFSHSKGIVHRDLKPDNVMIGEFGEVLVMDWGLALPTTDFEKTGLPASAGVAGTPAYMAPEMAGGPWELVGPASDIYLLGAILFRFATGRNAHTGENAFVALKAACDNVIHWPAEDDDVDHELLEIARIAMATRPEDRYPSVLAFQSALNEYRSHRESRLLTETAQSEMQAAAKSHDYRGFERAVASFEEALKLWSSNRTAETSLKKARLAYASTAMERGDFDLAESQLDPDDTTHQPLLERLQQARADRAAQRQRLKRWRRLAASLVAAVVVVVSVSAVAINIARVNEASARSEAVNRFIESQSAINELAGLADALKDYPLAQNERLKLLEAVAGYYERQATEVSEHPELRFEQLRSLVRLGEIQNLLGETEAAIASWNESQALAQELSEEEDLSENAPILFAEIFIGLSRSLAAQGRSDEAVVQASQAVSMLDACFSSTSSAASRKSLAIALLNRADLTKQDDPMQAAEEDLNRAISHFEELPDPEGLSGVASAQSMLAQIFQTRGEYDRAEQIIERAINIWTSLLEQDPENLTYLDGLATSQIDQANVLRSSGHNPLDAYEEAIINWDGLAALRPLNHRYRFNLATALTGLAWIQNQLNLTDYASQTVDAAIQYFGDLSYESPEDPRYLNGLISSELSLTEISKDRGDTDLALETLLILEERLNADTVDPDAMETMERRGELFLLRGMTEAVAGQTDEALASLGRAVDLLRSLCDSPSNLPRHADLQAWALFHLSHELASSGDHDAALTRYQQACDLRDKLPEEAMWLDSHAWLLLHPPKSPDSDSLAEPESADADSAGMKALRAVELAPRNPRFYRTLALARLRTGLLDEAAAALTDAARLSPADQPQHPEQVFLQAILNSKQNRTDEAAALLKAAQARMNEFSPGNSRQRFVSREAQTILQPE